MVIYTAFGLFVAVFVGAFMLVRGYLDTAIDPRTARLTIASGTVLVRPRGQADWISASSDRVLESGDSVRTDAISQALLTLFDSSTVLLFPNTDLVLSSLATNKFDVHRHQISLEIARGKTRLRVAPIIDGQRGFVLHTPHAVVEVEEGGLFISVEEEATQVRLPDAGKAKVVAKDETVQLRPGQRTEVVKGKSPQPPVSSSEELITNSDFLRRLEGWKTGNELGFPEGQDVVGEVEVVIDEGQPAIRLSRYNSSGTHCETYLYQDINREVTEFTELRLSVRFKLLYQSLSGGGYVGSEYPILLRIIYDTPQGKDFRVYGFYYQNDKNNRTDNGTKVPKDTWYTSTVPDNLLTLRPTPLRILAIQVSASGWDYESLVGHISLIGE